MNEMATATPLHRIFCDNVRARRLALGLTQRETAKRLGVSQPAYAEIESGRSRPNIETIERVAAVLEISAAELVTEQAAISTG